MSAKLVLGHSKYSSSEQALKELHWLPIRARIDFKILCLLHKCTYGFAPDYLRTMLKKKDQPTRQLQSWRNPADRQTDWAEIDKVR